MLLIQFLIHGWGLVVSGKIRVCADFWQRGWACRETSGRGPLVWIGGGRNAPLLMVHYVVQRKKGEAMQVLFRGEWRRPVEEEELGDLGHLQRRRLLTGARILFPVDR